MEPCTLRQDANSLATAHSSSFKFERWMLRSVSLVQYKLFTQEKHHFKWQYNFFQSSLLFVRLLCIKVIIFPSKAANFTVLKFISKQACSLQYYRDQIPICLSIRRYHRRENTYFSENITKNVAAVFSTF